jgi:predicted dehydrogenase
VTGVRDDDHGDRAAVGLIGCGKISEAYLNARYPGVRYVACADLDAARAAATAAAHGLRDVPVAELIADPTIDVVCNLTVPKAHVEISHAAMEAGKHVYQEKPLALDRPGGKSLLESAAHHGVALGCAPDTFLGAGLQTCRRLIDEGRIGRPVSAMAHMVNHGPERWHPGPAFYYQIGGGPLFDMGPYYLTALVSLLGPIARVSGMARGEGTQRTVGSGPLAGEILPVEVPTHVSGILEFVDGTIATLVTSFDVWASQLPRLEVHGTEGSLSCPDPNTFGGPVRFYPAGGAEWAEVPIDRFELNQRGIGLSDLVEAVRNGHAPRAAGALAYHVLDAMVALTDSSRQGNHVELQSSAPKPLPMPERTAERARAGGPEVPRPPNGGHAD